MWRVQGCVCKAICAGLCVQGSGAAQGGCSPACSAAARGPCTCSWRRRLVGLKGGNVLRALSCRVVFLLNREYLASSNTCRQALAGLFTSMFPAAHSSMATLQAWEKARRGSSCFSPNVCFPLYGRGSAAGLVAEPFTGFMLALKPKRMRWPRKRSLLQ